MYAVEYTTIHIDILTIGLHLNDPIIKYVNIKKNSLLQSDTTGLNSRHR